MKRSGAAHMCSYKYIGINRLHVLHLRTHTQGALSIMVIDWFIFKNNEITIFPDLLLYLKLVFDYLKQEYFFTVRNQLNLI